MSSYNTQRRVTRDEARKYTEERANKYAPPPLQRVQQKGTTYANNKRPGNNAWQQAAGGYKKKKCESTEPTILNNVVVCDCCVTPQHICTLCDSVKPFDTSNTLDELPPIPNYINDSKLTVNFASENFEVEHVLVDTGAVSQRRGGKSLNFISEKVALQLEACNAQPTYASSRICSATNDCSLARRKVFTFLINHGKFEKPLELSAVVLNKLHCDMIIGLDTAMQYDLVNKLIVPFNPIENSPSTVKIDTHIDQASKNPASGSKPTVRREGDGKGSIQLDSVTGMTAHTSTDGVDSARGAQVLQQTSDPEAAGLTLKCCPAGIGHVCTLRTALQELLDAEPQGEEIPEPEFRSNETLFPSMDSTSGRGGTSLQNVGQELEGDGVIPGPDNIFGSPELQKAIRECCEINRKAFSTIVRKQPARVTPMVLKVDEAQWYAPKGRFAARPQSTEKNSALRVEIQRLLAYDIIRLSKETHYSQALMVPKAVQPPKEGVHPLEPKKDKQWRFCIDFRFLNSCTSTEHWPLPNIQAMFKRLGDHDPERRPNVFGVLDMTSGYWQIPLSACSKKYTAFISAFGVYEWNRLVMGLKCAAAHFQRVMTTEVLHGLIHQICEAYLDDLIVPGANDQEFIDRLDTILKRCIAFNITLNPLKCKLGMAEIKYVGHTLSRIGYHFDRGKLDHVLRMPEPRTEGELRTFLGMANWFRDHVRDYATIAYPLHRVFSAQEVKPKADSEHNNRSGDLPTVDKSTYKPHRKIEWVPEMRHSFTTLKEKVNNCPLLHFVDSTSEVHVDTDASEIGYGAYMYQWVLDILSGKFKEHPILFLSKTWVKEQKRWSVPEKEAYAIYYTLRKWDYLLRDIKFVLHTDHRNLTFLNTDGSAKVKRWKLVVQDYDCDVQYIKGVDNIIADSFSRNGQLQEEFETPEAEQLSALFSEEWQEIGEHISILETQTPEATDYSDHCMLAAIRYSDGASLTADVYDHIKAVHNAIAGHSGVKRTLAKLKVRGATFPNMTECVHTFIQECPFCQKSNFRSVKIISKPYTLATQSIMQDLMMDHMTDFPPDDEGYRHILAITCTFSRWVMLFPTKTVGAEEACHALIQHMGIFGAPRTITSDGGAAFRASITLELGQLVGTEHNISIAHSSQRQAIIEARNKEVNRYLRALVYEQNSLAKWSIIVPFIQRILNAEVVESMGVAPARLLFGEAIDLDRSILKPNTAGGLTQATVDTDTLAKHTKNLIEAQRVAIKLAQSIQSKTDSTHKVKRTKLADGPITQFEPEEYVLCEYPKSGMGKKPPHKALTNLKGPLQVIKALNDGNEYEIRDLTSGKTIIQPINRLRPFKYDKERVNPIDVALRDGIESGSELYLVEAVLQHRGLHRYREELEFLVQWVGWPEPTWTPWANLRNNEIAHDYMRQYKELNRIIPKRYKK